MKSLREHLRRYLDGPMVRPLALAGPILVLLIALPLLRPLRNPVEISNDEMLRLATIRALVEHHSLALDHGYAKIPGAVQTASGVYSAQPPMMSLLLSAPAWVLNRMGIWFDNSQQLLEYFLTLLGVTLPAAAAAGLIYRMGRLFELPRPWRTVLGFFVVAASGMLSYAVVLNQYVPAATLILASAACLIYVNAMNRDDRRAGWFALAGACSALAATIDPASAVFVILFLLVIPAMRFSLSRRIVGVMLYILGTIPVFGLHAAWNNPVTGDAIPASIHRFFKTSVVVQTPAVIAHDDLDDDAPAPQTFWDKLGDEGLWFLNATIGEHGVFSHFPVVLLGVLGVGAVMHRHWPSSTKMLAGATAAAAVLIVIIYRVARNDFSNAMFATKWFIVFTPMLLFWAGAWMRRSHKPSMWALAGVLVLFSVIVGLIGATGPTPRHGFDGYTAVSATSRLIHSQPQDVQGRLLAGRTP